MRSSCGGERCDGDGERVAVACGGRGRAGGGAAACGGARWCGRAAAPRRGWAEWRRVGGSAVGQLRGGARRCGRRCAAMRAASARVRAVGDARVRAVAAAATRACGAGGGSGGDRENAAVRRRPVQAAARRGCGRRSGGAARARPSSNPTGPDEQ